MGARGHLVLCAYDNIDHRSDFKFVVESSGRTFNFENMINIVGTFALVVACVNCLLAIVIFWKAPGTHSVWLNVALLTPIFVLLLFPAVQAS